MSTNNCQLYVDGNGKYCCNHKVVKVDDCAYTLTVRGGPYTILKYPTGNTKDGTVVYDETPADGTITIAEPGRYTVELDCDALHGSPAPDPLIAQVVCWEENCINGLLELQILEVFETLCKKVVAGDDAVANAAIIAELQSLCTKLNNQLTADAVTDAAILACLATLKDQGATAATCFDEIKELLKCPPAAARGVITTW